MSCYLFGLCCCCPTLFLWRRSCCGEITNPSELVNGNELEPISPRSLYFSLVLLFCSFILHSLALSFSSLLLLRPSILPVLHPSGRRDGGSPPPPQITPTLQVGERVMRPGTEEEEWDREWYTCMRKMSFRMEMCSVGLLGLDGVISSREQTETIGEEGNWTLNWIYMMDVPCILPPLVSCLLSSTLLFSPLTFVSCCPFINYFVISHLFPFYRALWNVFCFFFFSKFHFNLLEISFFFTFYTNFTVRECALLQ